MIETKADYSNRTIIYALRAPGEKWCYVGYCSNHITFNKEYYPPAKHIDKPWLGALSEKHGGRKNLVTTVLDYADNEKERDRLEDLYIDELGTRYPNGWNYQSGGRKGFTESDETRALKSAANSGENNSRFNNPGASAKHSSTCAKNRELYLTEEVTYPNGRKRMKYVRDKNGKRILK